MHSIYSNYHFTTFPRSRALMTASPYHLSILSMLSFLSFLSFLSSSLPPYPASRLYLFLFTPSFLTPISRTKPCWLHHLDHVHFFTARLHWAVSYTLPPPACVLQHHSHQVGSFRSLRLPVSAPQFFFFVFHLFIIVTQIRSKRALFSTFERGEFYHWNPAPLLLRP